jgi:hypothetical protein
VGGSCLARKKSGYSDGAGLGSGAFDGGHKLVEFALLLFNFLFYLFDFFLHLLGLKSFDLQIHADIGEHRHVLVRDPDESKEADEVSAPVLKEKLVSGDEQEEGCDVMTEAIFAGEQVEEFALYQRRGFLAAALTIFARFAKDLFMRDRPGDTGDRNRQNEQPDDLGRERHLGSMRDRPHGLAALLH